jgi:ParB family chromosome partitioning protein
MGITAPICIDDEFQGLIPPLSEIERLQLEQNIKVEGCRDPLVVWLTESGDEILIDGHNRFEICERLGVQFRTVGLEFANRTEVLDWIYRNQLGRRNLSPADASELRGRMYNGRKKKHGGERKASPQNEDLKTAEVVAKETGVSKATIERDGKYAEAVDTVAKEVPEVREKVRSGEITKADVIKAAKTPEKVKEILAKPHVSNNSGNNEWYTPAEFCESARVVMGEITLDPASCKVANKQVRASKFFTAEQDGLNREWFGCVWLNPPYGQPLIADFAKKVVTEWQSGRIQAAIVLVNNATETAWFQSMLIEAHAVCFKSGRIRFLDATGAPANTPLQGQAFLYFGPDKKAFVREFSKYGGCLS